MKRNSSTFFGLRSVILALAVIALGLSCPAYCQTDNPVLLLQQTPPQGGKVTPSVGVHHFELSAEVTLTAVPEPGYQFVYWLGDVSDPTANSTVVYLDAPKIVIAVFEQAEYEFLVIEEGPLGSYGAPGGGLFVSAADYSRVAYAGGGGRRLDGWTPTDGLDKVSDPLPVPVPEPATAVLLVLGGLLAFAGRARKKQV